MSGDTVKGMGEGLSAFEGRSRECRGGTRGFGPYEREYTVSL